MKAIALSILLWLACVLALALSYLAVAVASFYQERTRGRRLRRSRWLSGDDE